MGFTAGFFGGLTLTTTVLYLTLHTHHVNRLHQSQILKQSHALLGAVLEKQRPDLYPSPEPRLQRVNLVETAKDRWNAELAGAVDWMYRVDWRRVRAGVERGGGRVWSRIVDEEQARGR
ncbi:MAG: hypothetical protein M1833_006093 [Piccolia ochrophora]|nr:MAG: hypothetical protein M1833_006093 [Piccolia ochrophora]